MRGAQPVQAVRVAGDLVDHAKRRRRRRHLTEQDRLIAQRAEVGQAVAAVGEHHREITNHAAAIMAAGTQLQPAKL